jgi:hypothetical protein
MSTYIEVNGEWVEGSPVNGHKFKRVNSKGGELISYYSEIVAPELPSKITKRALSQRLNPVIRKALRKSTDEIVIDIHEDLKLAEYVDLKDPDLITSFKYLVYVGLMTQEESDLVTEPPVTQSEAY